MYWVDPKEKSSIYRFVLRIGEQKIDNGIISIDERNSIDQQTNTIKCYMSTLRQWIGWKKSKGDNYPSHYKDYPWWNGEMIKKDGYSPLLWFRFWDLEDRHCVISAVDDKVRREQIKKSEVTGLLLAQPNLLHNACLHALESTCNITKNN